MKTFILVNPKAREGAVSTRWPELKGELLDALGTDEASTKISFTTPEDFGSGVVRNALLEGAGRVVVVGGDGTVSEAVQGFFENGKAIAPEAELAVMPAGRGDDFFKAVTGERILSSEETWRRGLSLLRSGKSRAIDVGRYDWIGAPGGRIFLNIASFGFPGLVVKRVLSHAGFWGRSRAGKSALTYLLQSGAAMLEYKPLELDIRADGKEFFSGLVFNGFVLNGHYNAGGVNWAADCKIDDGLFNLLVVEPQTKLQSMMCSPRMLSGRWEGAPGAHLTTAKRVEVVLRDGQTKGHPLFEIDGDLPEADGCKGAAFEILAGAIRLVG